MIRFLWQCTDIQFYISEEGVMTYRLDMGESGIVHPTIPSDIDRYPYWAVEDPCGYRHHTCHLLMARVFLTAPQDIAHPIVHHRDGNRLNWALSNLEYVSQSYNVAIEYALGRNKHGTAPHIVQMILDLLGQGISGKEISERCGVHPMTVSRIKNQQRHRLLSDQYQQKTKLT